MFDFVSKRHWFLLASAILVVIGLISVLVPGGLKLGMDFKGGMSATLVPPVTLVPNEGVTLNDVKEKLTDLGFPQVAEGVQQEAEGQFSVPTVNLDPALSKDDLDMVRNGLAEIGQVNWTLTIGQVKDKLIALGFSRTADKVQQLGASETDRAFLIRTAKLDVAEQQKLKDGLEEIGQLKEFMFVDAIVASKTARNAAIAAGAAMAAMLVYMTWAFRRMPSPVRYGTCAIVALLFNILMVLGIFSFLGRTLDWEIDPMFITAMLAVIGYSINDTIVVLDRVRENVVRLVSPDFGITVNRAITETLTRSLNTAITTVLAVLAVYAFVGGPIEHFLIALLVGIVAGTYSSIFITSELLVVWETRKWRGDAGKLPVAEKTEVERQGTADKPIP
ncbi:MAG: protein translocase subunit SecF [Chloroflexi bacterium]|nr:protein translocase subunit SecF [Chloroflexota bacterium]